MRLGSALVLTMIVVNASAAGPQQKGSPIEWRSLPPLPRPVAGQFVGTIGDRLLVAGGSYWTVPPAHGGQKKFVDDIQVLAADGRAWHTAGHLPEGLAYGGTVSTGTALICIGGQTETGATAGVLRLTLDAGEIRITRLPDLPAPRFNIAAALSGNIAYVAGGQAGTDATSVHEFLQLNLGAKVAEAAWKPVPPWRGPSRILAALVACGDDVYVLGGAELYRDADGSTRRRYLNDAFRYRAGDGWRAIRSLPHPAVAAPAACSSSGAPLLFGGDDGSLARRTLQGPHPGFSRTAWRYYAQGGVWIEAGEMPAALVTTGAAVWKRQIVIAGGEDRPGSRSGTVIAGKER